VHAIGDRANHVVLNAMEAVIGDDLAQGKERRLRMEHAQIMTPEDLKRAVRLGGMSIPTPPLILTDRSGY
jgi:predicted amidohydrolase YtcJ